MSEPIRINKFIASNGFFSRRKIDEMILEGRVTVNGATIFDVGFKVDPEKDKIAVDGENVKTGGKKIYVIMNKPDDIITSVSDEKQRKTVIDIIKIKQKIFPIGRLDYHTTGLLLLTNDGELANKLMSPKSKIYKTYYVKLSRPLEEKHRYKLTEGVSIEQKEQKPQKVQKVITKPSKIRFIVKGDFSRLHISIYEGKNRQVRKMFEKYGYFIKELHRTEYAGLKLGSLKPGQWRYLTAKEVADLQTIS